MVLQQSRRTFPRCLQTSHVLPALHGKQGELLLMELCKQFTNYRILTEWMKRMFKYIDLDAARPGAKQRPATLTSVGLSLFNTVVFEKKKSTLSNTIIQLINRDREGEVVDRSGSVAVADLLSHPPNVYATLSQEHVKDCYDDVRDDGHQQTTL
jgi:hypothetical protein